MDGKAAGNPRKRKRAAAQPSGSAASPICVSDDDAAGDGAGAGAGAGVGAGAAPPLYINHVAGGTGARPPPRAFGSLAAARAHMFGGPHGLPFRPQGTSPHCALFSVALASEVAREAGPFSADAWRRRRAWIAARGKAAGDYLHLTARAYAAAGFAREDGTRGELAVDPTKSRRVTRARAKKKAKATADENTIDLTRSGAGAQASRG